MIKKVLEIQTEEKCKLKALEEMSELSECLLKSLTKNGKDKPPLSKIIEEMGDVEVRLNILKHKLGIVKEVGKRYAIKSEEIRKYYESK